jgi:hypothetical protein
MLETSTTLETSTIDADVDPPASLEDSTGPWVPAFSCQFAWARASFDKTMFLFLSIVNGWSD